MGEGHRVLLEIADWGQNSARFPGLLGSRDGLSRSIEHCYVNFVFFLEKVYLFVQKKNARYFSQN